MSEIEDLKRLRSTLIQQRRDAVRKANETKNADDISTFRVIQDAISAASAAIEQEEKMATGEPRYQMIIV